MLFLPIKKLKNSYSKALNFVGVLVDTFETNTNYGVNSEACSESYQTSKMEQSTKIVNSF